MSIVLTIVLFVSINTAQCRYVGSGIEWESWKFRNSKMYSREEEEKRREIWEDNKLFVEEGNSKNSFQLELNRFGDLVC